MVVPRGRHVNVVAEARAEIAAQGEAGRPDEPQADEPQTEQRVSSV
jgi:hypothetical protein